MKRKWKIAGFCLLIALSLGLKALYTVWVLERDFINESLMRTFLNMSFDNLIYLIDAVAVLIVFAFFEKRLRHVVSKIAAAMGLTAAYLAAVAVCNYSWHALDFNAMFKFEPPLVTPLSMAKRGFDYYVKTGKPGYHWVVLAMLVACALIVLFRRYENTVCPRIKDFLVQRSVKATSNFATLFYLCIVLNFFRKYVDDRELEWIKEIFFLILTEKIRADAESELEGCGTADMEGDGGDDKNKRGATGLTDAEFDWYHPDGMK